MPGSPDWPATSRGSSPESVAPANPSIRELERVNKKLTLATRASRKYQSLGVAQLDFDPTEIERRLQALILGESSNQPIVSRWERSVAKERRTSLAGR